MSRLPRLSPVLIVVALALGAATAGIAIAATSGSSDQVRGCVSSRTGVVRVLSSKKTKCPRGTRALSWNKHGPQGAAGTRGASGATGAAGARGATGCPGTGRRAGSHRRPRGRPGRPRPSRASRPTARSSRATGPPEQERHRHEHRARRHHRSGGVYRFGGLSFGVASAMVSSSTAPGTSPHDEIANVAIQRGITLSNCDASHQQARVSMVAVSNAAAPTLTDHRFQVWFEATGSAQIAQGPGGE